ncbi:hypothetical protein [Coleofasciculus sp.]|uniref:hypothetical protein n=1 Tax=Coleofasciculus sp. TaxID=3100458 RepID=UPI003A25AC96
MKCGKGADEENPEDQRPIAKQVDNARRNCRTGITPKNTWISPVKFTSTSYDSVLSE